MESSKKWKARVYVTDPIERSHIPFLRGILTRSLQKAGLSFADAYSIASEVRNNLKPGTEITTEKLSEKVSKLLKKEGFETEADRYEQPTAIIEPILVEGRDGHLSPFSKNTLTQTLEICTLPPGEGYRIAADIEYRLQEERRTQVYSTEILQMVYKYLLENQSKDIALRYTSWVDFTNSGKPLILLVGGATGCGKSTISSEIAHRLNIVRTQSTDMLREVMRLMIPKRLAPTLHQSTFSAWEALPHHDDEHSSNLIMGYLTQAEQVSIGIEGVLKRAEKEQISIILEGIHMYPALQCQLADQSNAVVIPIVLAVLKKKQLRKQLSGRGKVIESRRTERYMGNLENIWQLQSFLLDQADENQVSIIQNGPAFEETVQAVMATISDHILRVHPGEPPEEKLEQSEQSKDQEN